MQNRLLSSSLRVASLSMNHILRWEAGWLKWVVLSFCSASVAQADSPGFNRDIRPILSDRCYVCHGPDKAERKADLRLDTREGALSDLGGYSAIVPGHPEKSELVVRIEAQDPDDIMPPPDSHLTLSLKEKKLLREWIQAGAEWEGHWAFESASRPDVPIKTGIRRNQNPIDAFVRAALKERGIAASPAADDRTWIRRVTQDITGLPPTVDQMNAFLEDCSTGARSDVVARLLDSEDYAERMALNWLDNARYADSNGYQFDNRRTMWPWRDWVVNAFRKNMPYDRFVIEQVAGDLLETPDESQLIASGFNRNHGYSIEGGIIDEEYRVMYANDKTTTFGTLFLGLTLECTRCHDHKYDPLTMGDYYSLFAFFNTSAEAGAPGEKGRKEMAAAPYISLGGDDDQKQGVRVMVMKEKPRDTFILEQGLFDQPGEKVLPRTPSVLPPFDGYRADRLGARSMAYSR